ncbi:MAG: hypothetical protein SFV32_13860 [Opitutaceae bacterium]|nr:hypothetical protein [Opitutaceae bacterium]
MTIRTKRVVTVASALIAAVGLVLSIHVFFRNRTEPEDALSPVVQRMSQGVAQSLETTPTSFSDASRSANLKTLAPGTSSGGTKTPPILDVQCAVIGRPTPIPLDPVADARTRRLETEATSAMILAHRSLMTNAVNNPDSEENQKILDSMIRKSLNANEAQ